MMYQAREEDGFTIVEILIVVAVIAVLGAIAMIGYQQYTARARAADILVKYDAIRTAAGIRLSGGGIDDCDKLAKGLGTANLADDYANLSYSFESVAGGGYRPVLNVCATADSGSMGVSVAKGAYDTMLKVATVEKNPVLTDAVVSFSLPLSATDKAFCKNFVAPATLSCNASQAKMSSPSTANPQPPAVTAAASAPVAATVSAPAAAASPMAPQVQAALARPGTTKDDLANLFRTAASTLPDTAKTVGIPVTSADAKALLSSCPVDTSKNADEYLGVCKEDFPGMCTECFVAAVCQKSCGLVDGITALLKS
ncbi:MAG: prepilin-type N-terminal cleavage/methylation domain-containing protein [Rhodoferax sp.]|nr:prepilin-type N-terminal cleavage/methylation domain-containing protein [Rhodoferax sp.]